MSINVPHIYPFMMPDILHSFSASSDTTVGGFCYSFNFKFCCRSHLSQSFNAVLLSVHGNGEDLLMATEAHLRQNSLNLFPVATSGNGLKILINGIFKFTIYFIS